MSQYFDESNKQKIGAEDEGIWIYDERRRQLM